MRRLGVTVGIVAALTVGLPAAPAQAPSPDRLERGLVAIEAQIGDAVVRSSGTVIDGDDGLILTAAHSIWGAKSLRLSAGVGILHGGSSRARSLHRRGADRDAAAHPRSGDADRSCSGQAADRAVRAGRLPTDVAVADGTVWVASGRDNRIVAIDAARPQAAAERHETGAAPLRLAVGDDGSIWTADATDDTVTRVNPLLPGSVGRRIGIGADAVDIAIGFDGAWVTNGQRGTVTRARCSRFAASRLRSLSGRARPGSSTREVAP